MCSSTLGPATTPSFVTCPTMKMDVPLPFAICIKTPVDSRTWETLPGADVTLSLYIVWIESITTTSGFSRSMTACTTSRSVSQSSFRESVKEPMRPARSLICCRDSSPEM